MKSNFKLCQMKKRFKFLSTAPSSRSPEILRTTVVVKNLMVKLASISETEEEHNYNLVSPAAYN